MIVYESDVKGFRNDVLANRIEERIHELFQNVFRRKTSQSEVKAWKNSLGHMDRVLADPTIPENAGVAIEFLIPGMANRIDFVLSGLDINKKKVTVIIELKQWTEARLTTKDGVVETFLAGHLREVSHPSYQAWSYATLLEDFNVAVRSAPIRLLPCAYLHNCESGSVIRNPFYDSYTSKAPTFLRDDAGGLRKFIASHVKYGDINLLVRFIQGHLTSKYITKNSAPRAVYEARLTGTLKKTSISNLFGGPDSFLNAKPNTFGALLVDEAHRLREKSGMFGNLGENQIKHLIEAAHLTVFFVDDAQRVTLKDIGGVAEIANWARKLDANVTHMELPSQFRCGGSDGYIAWIDHTLGIRETANPTLKGIKYDFRVCDSANQLRDHIRKLNRTSNKARMVAGYCWKWKSKKDSGAMDIVLSDEDFSAQWNFSKDGGTWIIRPDSVEQIGCVHTVQGLELDYVGVILGHDLVVRNNQWMEYPDRRAKEDSSIKGFGRLLLNDRATGERRICEVIRNTYRTLMTRGAKGCYVYSVDAETNAYLRTAMGREQISTDIISQQTEAELERVTPFRILESTEIDTVSNRVRYFPSIEAAAGSFSATQSDENSIWVEISDTYRVTPDMFIIKVVGESMNRRIPNKSWCLFRHNPTGSRDGKIVLVQHQSISDHENGGQFTVKRYRSAKHATEESWAHTKITLWPDSDDRAFLPISISVADENEFKVIGEFIGVLSN